MSSVASCCLRYGTPWTRFFHIIQSHQNYVKSRPHIDKTSRPTTPFRCPYCFECFKTKKETSVHSKLCGLKASFGCGLCPSETCQAFSDRGLLFHFLTFHRFGACGLPCPNELCDCVKPSSSELQRHIQDKHRMTKEEANDQVEKVEEKLFPKKFRGEDTIQRIPTYVCPCGLMDFSGKSGKGKQHLKNYERHLTKCKIAIREGVQPQQRECDLCGKPCKTADALAQHKQKCKAKRAKRAKVVEERNDKEESGQSLKPSEDDPLLLSNYLRLAAK